MSEPHTIPDHVAARIARLINEAEDMRQQAADDLKQIYADLRDELRGMGWIGSVVSAEVAALKGAISEMRLDDKARDKREAKDDRVSDYVLLLNLASARAPAREKTLDNFGSYAEAKGVDRPAQKIIDGLAEALAIAKGEAEPHRVHTFGPVTPLAGNEADEVAAAIQPETATESVQPQEAVVASEYAGTSSDENPAPNSHSSDDLLPVETDKTGAVVPPPAAVPVAPFEPPAFLVKAKTLSDSIMGEQ